VLTSWDQLLGEMLERDGTYDLTSTTTATARNPPPAVGVGRIAWLLKEDRELAQQLPEAEREHAEQLLRSPVIELECGRWTPPQPAADADFGLLLLDGLVARRVAAPGAFALEILGPGDIVRASEYSPLADASQFDAGWEVFQPARLAVLDKRVIAMITRWPELTLALSDRLVRRTQRLGHLLAVSHLPRLEDRLLGTLRCLAASWGRVTPRGLRVPIALTHEALGELAGARRPSVTLALAALRDRGLVTRMPDGTYLLCGDGLSSQQPPSVLGTDARHRSRA
jgi:CRP/FNR family transcriptional regulator, cyclic AMP receptor protein